MRTLSEIVVRKQKRKEQEEKKKESQDKFLAIDQHEIQLRSFFQDYDDEIENGRGRRHSSPGGSRGNPRDYGHHLHPDNLVSRLAQTRSSDTRHSIKTTNYFVYSRTPLKRDSDRTGIFENAKSAVVNYLY